VPQLWGSKALIKKWIAAIFFFICLVLVAVSYFYWDKPLTLYCNELGRPVRDIAEIVTIWGDSLWYYIILVPAFICFWFLAKNKLWSKRILFILISLSASGLISTLIKWFLGRYRPSEFLKKEDLFGFNFFGIGYGLTSLPSGHTVTAFSLAAAVSILFPRAGIAAFIIAISIGMTRIILTSHYLSDVIAGAGIGILSTLLVKYFFDRKKIELIQK
jgi:membrane-associated phospholipid phosphatase